MFSPPPQNFDNTWQFFSYRANDGQYYSNSTYVTLLPVDTGSPIVQLAAGEGHNCTLLSDGSVRCWGIAGYGLGYGSIYGARVGDLGTPLAYTRFDIGESFIKLDLGSYFSCGLTDTGKVRCWGQGSVLGFRHEENVLRPPTLTPASGINFGTDLKVIDIASTESAACALFENGKVKCWGRNLSGQLGLGRPFASVGGNGVKVKDTNFLNWEGECFLLRGRRLGIDFAHC